MDDKTYTDKLNTFKKKVRRALGGYPRATTVSVRTRSPFQDNEKDADTLVVVTYHSTDVVTIHLDAQARPTRIVLDSGMWHTATTRVRMNAILDVLAHSYDPEGKCFSCYVSQSKKKMRFGYHGWMHVDPDPGSVDDQMGWKSTRHFKGVSIPFVDGLTIHLYKNGSIRKITDEKGSRLLPFKPWKEAS